MTAVLAVNPGSTTTMVALFEDGTPRFERELHHSKDELTACGNVAGQLDYRLKAIRTVLQEEGTTRWDAVSGRGGLLRPMEGGVYEVTDEMIEDMLSARYGEHPCNLGAPLARRLADEHGVPAVIADPVVTDEMDDRTRLTGLPGIERRSVFHALNQKGAVRRVSEKLGINPLDGHFLVIHVGGGISVGAHRRGRVADVINALDGEGPFSPERSGALPNIPVLELVKSGTSVDDLKRMILREGGLFAHLGTNDLREVARMVDAGNETACAVFEAFAYNIAKSLTSLLPALAPAMPDAIVVTGGAARSELLVETVRELVEHIAPVHVVPGSVEMEALAEAARIALESGTVKQYVRG